MSLPDYAEDQAHFRGASIIDPPYPYPKPTTFIAPPPGDNTTPMVDTVGITHAGRGGGKSTLVKGLREMTLPTDPALRKGMPITSGVLDYFPLAIAEVSKCSKAGNDQHNPGKPMHWDKTKSTDHADCIPRHLIDRGTVDTDGIRHSAKLAWRALALLQIELEGASK